MAATAEIRFSADVRNAQKNIRALNSEVEKLSTRLESTQSVSRQTNTGVTALGTGTRQVSTQVRVASTALDSLEQSMNEARRSALGLRDRIINLNAELAENRKRLLSADGAQKQVIETRNRAIRVNQSFISVEKQRNAQALAQFTQQRRELGGLSGGYREAARGAGFLSRAGSELAGTLGAIGITELGFAAVRFGSETVNAAVKVEGFQNSLTALYGDAQVAERVLNDLRDAAQLPGITFQGAVRGAVRLKTVGVEGERSLAVIREWGNAAALGGSSADDMGRSLVGLTQILSRGKVSQEELNQILEAVPLIGNSIREAFGSIDAETIRDTLDAAGQDVNDFVDILVNQLSMGARASADSTANAFSNLGNATFELQAAIGSGLTPVAADFARGLTGVISRITDFIDNTDSAKDAQIAFREALENSDTVLEQRGAVDARIQYLENYKQALFDAANELDKFDRRRQEIQSQVDDANEQLETLKLIREGAISAAQLRQELGGLVDEYSELFAEEQKREEQAQLTHLAVSNVAIARLKGIREEKAELESEIDVYRNYIDIAEAAQKGTFAALEADETAKNRNIAVTALLTATTREAVNQQKELADTIISNEQAFAMLTPTVEQLALAYQAAQTVADLLDNSMTDLEDTLLTGADPLKEYVAGLTLTSESADAALGSVNEVGEAANNADFSRASEGLYDFQDAVENTRRSHIDFRDVVDRETTPAVEDLTTALDASAQTSEQTQRAFDALDTVMDETGDTAGDTEVKIGELGETSDETARSTRRLEQQIFNVNKALAEGKISAEDAEEQIGLLRDAFNTFGHDGTLGVNQIIGAFDTLADSLADAEGSIGDVGVGLQGLADLFSNPLDFAANTLGAVFVGLANANTFGGPLGLPEGFFDDPVAGTAQVDPRNIQAAADQEALQIHTAGIARYLETPGGIDIIRQNQPELFHRPGTRAFIEQNYPELVDQIYPRGQGFNQAGALAGRAGARSTAERTGTDRQAIEDIARNQYGGLIYDAEVAAATAIEDAGDEVAAAITAGADPQNNDLLQNQLLRSQFALGLSTDEGDFEANRQTLILQTNTYYNAELERINGLMLSEAELQDQREDNELARDRAIQRAIGTTNTFTETRLQGEQDVADAAERTAAQLQREQERAATAAARIAERQQRDAERADEQEVRQAERLTEQQVREQARIAQEQEREQERQRRSAEQQAGRESAAGAGLLQTGVGRAQFELGLSTSESDFEANRQTLTAATNAYYDNELARIDELMRTEIELRDLRESNALARERALQRATDTTNPFEQQRLQDAADAQRETERATAEAERLAERQQREQTQAVERAERERVRAAERTAREQMRIAERQQREEERAIEMRIRQEMRLQDDISDLREDAVENEADRIQAITDLHENAARQREQIEKNHQDRLEDIRRSADESREGVEREFTQDIEDILRDAGVDESLFSHGNFDTIRRIAQSPSGLDDLQGFLSGLGINLDARGVEGVRSAGVDRLRGLENVDIRTGHEQENAQVRQRRALEDLAQRTEGREADINAQAEATAEALTEALTPLLGEESAFNTETAEKTDTAATNLNTAAGKTDAAATNLDTATQAFADSDLPGAVDLVRESAEASLGISEAIEMFPAALESAVTDAFDRVLGELEDTFERLILLADTPTAPGGGAGGEGGGDAATLATEQAQDTMMTLQAAEPIPATMDPLPVEVTNEAALMTPDMDSALAGAQPDEEGESAITIGSASITIGSASISGGGMAETSETPPVGVPVPVPVPVPVGGAVDERLFHFTENDAIVRRAARVAASAQRNTMPNYVPSAEQRQNARDLSHEVAAGVQEGLAGQPRGGRLSDQLLDGSEQTIEANITLQYGDGTVSDLGDQVLRLKNQDRSF